MIVLLQVGAPRPQTVLCLWRLPCFALNATGYVLWPLSRAESCGGTVGAAHHVVSTQYTLNTHELTMLRGLPSSSTLRHTCQQEESGCLGGKRAMRKASQVYSLWRRSSRGP